MQRSRQRLSISSQGTSAVTDAQQLSQLVKLLEPYSMEHLPISAGTQTALSIRPQRVSSFSDFCEARGVHVLPLSSIKQGVYVTHQQRQAMKVVEDDESHFRALLSQDCDVEYREGFTILAAKLHAMHQSHVSAHSSFIKTEAAERQKLKEHEEAMRVPISHAKCAAEYNAEFLEQVLKRGSIIEDDMLRERKFTAEAELVARTALHSAMRDSYLSALRKMSEHIHFVNIQAASFTRAAAAFHATVFDLNGAVRRIHPDNDVRHSLLVDMSKSAVDAESEEDQLYKDLPMNVKPLCGTTTHKLRETIRMQEALASKPARFRRRPMPGNMAGNACRALSASRRRSGASVGSSSNSQHHRHQLSVLAFRRQWWRSTAEVSVLLAELAECKEAVQSVTGGDLAIAPSIAVTTTPISSCREQLNKIKCALEAALNDEGLKEGFAQALPRILSTASALLVRFEDGDCAAVFAATALQHLRHQAYEAHYAVDNHFFQQAIAALVNLSFALSMQTRQPMVKASSTVEPLDLLLEAERLCSNWLGSSHPLTKRVVEAFHALVEAEALPWFVQRAAKGGSLASSNLPK